MSTLLIGTRSLSAPDVNSTDNNKPWKKACCGMPTRVRIPQHFFQGWLLSVLLTSGALSEPVPIDTVVQHWLLAIDHDCIAVGLSFESPSMQQKLNVNISWMKEGFWIMLAEKQNLLDQDPRGGTTISDRWKSLSWQQQKYHHVNPCTIVNRKPSSHEYP